jgi:aspartyl-tRNA synthetase
MFSLKRSVWCGEVSDVLIDKEIIINGWVNARRDHGGVIFIDVRDRSGILQVVFDPQNNADYIEDAKLLRDECVIAVQGKLVYREKHLINDNLKTGKFEIKVKNFEILSKAKVPPFQLENANQVNEDLRLTYRYLDLRRPEMYEILKLRYDVLFELRKYFKKQGYLEIETPILSKSTPEGARDYLVPSRMQKHNFYALPQSPQIYKQLLMCAGIERYFQIARCFRDEDLRADRQPEFTQLDIEASFVDEEDIFSLTERFMKIITKKFLNIDIDEKLDRYTYDEVFKKYGSDAPDMRFGLEIHDLSKFFETIDLKFLQNIFNNNGKAGALCVKNKNFSRSELDGWIEKVKKEFGAQGLLYIRFDEQGKPGGPIAKYLSKDSFNQLKAMIPGLQQQDTLFVAAGEYKEAWSLLGKLRVEFGKAFDLIDKQKHSLFWVTDFPMFAWVEEEKKWVACHHPFTQPQEGWGKFDPGEMKARAYDLVWNGYEIGGGSIRIHDHEMQQKIFGILGLSKQEVQEKFGFLLEAQQLGYPPEGGIAFGIERLIMIIAQTPSIRDVIAFPKTQKAGCLMMDSPSNVDKRQLGDLGLIISD